MTEVKYFAAAIPSRPTPPHIMGAVQGRRAMTPQERPLIDELFDRLATLERMPRDPEAERAIAEGLAKAPHAVYPLVQTVLVQDEALKRADARIRELEGGEAPGEGASFLDTMREALTGRRGSVPTVRPGASDPRWGAGAAQQPQNPAFGSGGGSFLGTAAATAAGVIGGSLLFHSISSMMGGGRAEANPSGFGNMEADSPWGGGARDSELAREAGIDDIGRGGPLGSGNDNRAGLFDTGEDPVGLDDAFDVGGDGGGDFGGGDPA
jgi:hypothetical protein